MSESPGILWVPEQETRQLRSGHRAGGNVCKILALSIAHILRPSSLERGPEFLAFKNRLQRSRRCVVIQNGRSQIGQGALLSQRPNSMAHAFMLTDSCAFRAFSSFILREALLRCERSFINDFAST
jgi:hypothetical protein